MEVINEEEEEITRNNPLLAQQFRDNIKPLYETAVSYNQGVWYVNFVFFLINFFFRFLSNRLGNMKDKFYVLSLKII